MSKPITCTLCGGEVDDSDSVEMPNGPMCLDPCYLWVEKMIEQSEGDDDDDEEVTFYFFDEEEEEEEEDERWGGEELI